MREKSAASKRSDEEDSDEEDSDEEEDGEEEGGAVAALPEVSVFVVSAAAAREGLRKVVVMGAGRGVRGTERRGNDDDGGGDRD